MSQFPDKSTDRQVALLLVKRENVLKPVANIKGKLNCCNICIINAAIQKNGSKLILTSL